MLQLTFGVKSGGGKQTERKLIDDRGRRSPRPPRAIVSQAGGAWAHMYMYMHMHMYMVWVGGCGWACAECATVLAAAAAALVATVSNSNAKRLVLCQNIRGIHRFESVAYVRRYVL